jgi:hypothetical protein
VSDDTKKPASNATPRKRATPRGEGTTAARNPGGKSLSPNLWIAARALYEGDLKITMSQVADEFGISAITVKRRSQEERWTKRVETLADMSERAHHLADSAKSKLDAIGPELTSAAPEDAEAAKAEVQKQVTIEAGAEARAKIIERHREEWKAPRQLAYEAIKDRNFDRAKLAKISSETLTLIQAGERKAWGIDRQGEGDGKPAVVIIERS